MATDTAPRVSVITPVYNGERFVGEAIQSALDQTYRSFEIIVADDGSTDGSREVVRTFGDPVQLIQLVHRGISATRNAAVAAARGEYLALLDADDLWLPRKLELLVAYLDAHPEVALAYSDSTNFTDEGGGVELVKQVEYGDNPFVDILNGTSVPVLSTMVMRRAAFVALGGYNESLAASEDADLTLRLLRRYGIGRVPQSLVRRRIHPDSYYTSGYDSQYIFEMPVFEKVLSEPGVPELLGTTKEAHLSAYICKFIYKNLYDSHQEFIPKKLADLQRYATPEVYARIAGLVANNDASAESWEPLIANFAAWHAIVEHKSKLFATRRKTNFDIGAGRL